MVYQFDNGLSYDNREHVLSYEGRKQTLRRGQRALFEVIIENEHKNRPPLGTRQVATLMEEEGITIKPEIISSTVELANQLNSCAHEIRKKIRDLLKTNDSTTFFITGKDGWRLCNIELVSSPIRQVVEDAATDEKWETYEKRYAQANQHYMNGNIATTFHMLKELADAGYLKAINAYGVMIAKGQGTDRNVKDGLRYVRCAAEKGLSTAQLNLGLAYRWAYGLKPDYEQAFEWFLKAAENPIEPDADAFAWLSECYRLGIGTEVNEEEAEQWAQKARDNGMDPQNPVNYWTRP